MAPKQYDVSLAITSGSGRVMRPVVLAGESVPIRIAASVEANRSVASGLRLEVRRPDGITAVLEERDLDGSAIGVWDTVLCLDVPGTYELSATCSRPSPARAVTTLQAQAAPGDPVPDASGAPLLTQAGLPLLRQDGRPLTL